MNIEKENLEEDFFKKFPEVYNNNFGSYKSGKIKLYVKDDVRPTFLQSKPVPSALKDQVNTEIDGLENQGNKRNTQ